MLSVFPDGEAKGVVVLDADVDERFSPNGELDVVSEEEFAFSLGPLDTLGDDRDSEPGARFVIVEDDADGLPLGDLSVLPNVEDDAPVGELVTFSDGRPPPAAAPSVTLEVVPPVVELFLVQGNDDGVDPPVEELSGVAGGDDDVPAGELVAVPVDRIPLVEDPGGGPVLVGLPTLVPNATALDTLPVAGSSEGDAVLEIFSTPVPDVVALDTSVIDGISFECLEERVRRV